jgi:hypothetical protein
MKRSEMLEHLQEVLIEFFSKYAGTPKKSQKYVIERYADEILSFQEGFGMLPPEHGWIDANGDYHSRLMWQPEED